MSRTSRILLLPALVAATLAAGGCDSDPSGPTQTSVAGSYALHSVNGDVVPATVLEWTLPTENGEESFRMEVIDGSLTLNANGTYTTTGLIRTTNLTLGAIDEEDPIQASGTWSLSGRKVSLLDAEGEASTATVSGGELVVEVPVLGPLSERYVFRRQS